MEYKVSVWGVEAVARAKNPQNWPQNRAKSLTGNEVWRLESDSEKRSIRGQERLCSMCQMIDFKYLFSELLHDNKDEVILGYLDEIEKNVDCNFCHLLVDTICDFTGVRPVMTVFQGQRIKCDLRNIIGGYRMRFSAERHIWLCCVPELPPARKSPPNFNKSSSANVRPLNTPLPWCMKQSLGGQYMKLQRIDDDPEWPGSGRYVSQYVDFQLLNSWLHNFPATHPLARGNSAKLPSSFRLIDIEQQCLVHAPPDVEYAILSYVWGRLERKFLRALKENLVSLERQGGINPDDPLLPRTIRDVMEVVRGLEQRYLWVDSLCIVQDDPVSNSSQIAAMDVIYNLASFTIIAASSEDADGGLPGSPRTPRKISQFKARIMGMTIVNRFPDLNDDMDPSLWNTRAWTFQERVLSQRYLVFTDKQVHYFARGHVRMCEDSIEDTSLDPAPMDSHRIDNTQPSWFQYANSVANYSSRKLSFQSDVLNGFTGIMKVFQPRFGGEYVFGLPGVLLDWALLWHSKTPLTRFDAIIPGKPRFPSYCWSGWIGEVVYEFPRQLYSRVLWTNHGTDALEDVFTTGTYLKKMRRINEGDIDIWRENGVPTDNKTFEESQPERPLQHDSPLNGYLNFWTQIAFFDTTPPNTSYPFIVTNLMGCDLDPNDGRFKFILNARNTVIGAVHLDSFVHTLPSHEKLAFILLSRTTTISKRRDKLERLYKKDNLETSEDDVSLDQTQFDADQEDMSDDFELYNVMAVYTSRPVFERIGIGMIERKAFCEAGSKRRLITLG